MNIINRIRDYIILKVGDKITVKTKCHNTFDRLFNNGEEVRVDSKRFCSFHDSENMCGNCETNGIVYLLNNKYGKKETTCIYFIERKIE